MEAEQALAPGEMALVIKTTGEPRGPRDILQALRVQLTRSPQPETGHTKAGMPGLSGLPPLGEKAPW